MICLYPMYIAKLVKIHWLKCVAEFFFLNIYNFIFEVDYANLIVFMSPI